MVFEPPVRKVLKLAPDAIVFINGERYVPVGTAVTEKNVYNAILSIQISSSIEPVPNTANISVADPRTGDAPWFLNDTITTFAPFSEVEIFLKGRFLVGGKPAYYSVFWGLISSVTKSYSGGFHTLELECADMLRWWEITFANVNPSLIDVAYLPGVDWTVFVNRYHNMNPYEIIYHLAKLSFENVFPDFKGVERFGATPADRQTPRFRGNIQDLLKHWQERFSLIGTMVRCVGMGNINPQPDAITGIHARAEEGHSLRPHEGSTHAGEPSLDYSRFEPIAQEIIQYKPYFELGGGGDLVESDYRSRLEIAAEVADLIGYEFFQDVTGEIIFKPPFYNLNVKPNKPVSWIEDIDIINWSTTDSEREIQATRMDVFGSLSTWTAHAESKIVKPRGTAIDYKLATQFGLRPATKVSTLWRTGKACFIYAVTELDKANMRRFSSTVSIPIRPELRLGFPIYVPSQDAFHYIHGLTHNIDFAGMQAQTQLSLIATRRLYRNVTMHVAEDESDTHEPEDVGTWEAGLMGDIAGPPEPPLFPSTPDNTAPSGGLKSQAAVTGGSGKAKPTRSTKTAMGLDFTSHPEHPNDEAKRKELQKTTHPHMDMDVYWMISEGGDTATQDNWPASDEFGYEVVGGFKYGRGLNVSVTGNLSNVDEGHSYEDAQPSDDPNSPMLPALDAPPDNRNPPAYNPSDPTNSGARALRFNDLGPRPGGGS